MADNPILNEDVTFIQHHLPGLDAGSYVVEVEQVLLDQDKKFINDGNADPITATYNFAVTGDRFKIKFPTKVISSIYPAANATGAFNTILPSVIFSQKTFPWIRFPTNTPPQSTEADVVDKDVPTWLAILTIDEDDVALWEKNKPADALDLDLSPISAKVADLFPEDPTNNPKSTLGPRISYFQGVTKPSERLQPGETLDEPIQILDIPLTLFWSIAPCLDDLNVLAHARMVSLINKSDAESAGGEPVGDFSIVFGNRLPQLGKKTTFFMVSLEQMEDYLPDTNGNPPSDKANLLDKTLRLAVLKNWTIYPIDKQDNFENTLQALNDSGAEFSNLQLPYAGPADNMAKNAFGMGYIPLRHELRTGGQTVSWYRGPLAPQKVTEGRISVPIQSADQATFYDPSVGMFDVSYSMAWTLGRQLSLQAKDFSMGLYKWKRGLSQKLISQIEDELITEAFKPIVGQGKSTDDNGDSLHASRKLYHGLMHLIANQNEDTNG